MTIYKFYIIILAINLISCGKSKTAETNLVEWNKPDSILVKEIRTQAKILSLQTIETGFDSLQIRIWCDYSIVPERKLIILKNKNSNWSAEIYEITINSDKNEEIEGKKIRKISPKNGWDKFTNQLLQLDIINLPDMKNILAKNETFDDATTYTVEIASQNKYRVYAYEMPSEYQQRYREAKQFTLILKLIENEFEVVL